MKTFSEFNIMPSEGNLRGPKIKVKEVLGKEIIVHGFKVTPSKFNTEKKCLHIQIEHQDQKRVIFTSAHALVEVIQQIPKPAGFPFKTIIRKQNDRYEFT